MSVETLSLLKALCTTEFPVDERKRLQGLFEGDGQFLQNIISKYARRTEPYSSFEKGETIKGFRKGSPEYHKMAIPRLVKYFSDEQYLSNRVLWDIYRYSYLHSLEDNKKDLFRLFQETPIYRDKTSAAELFRSICENSYQYSVPQVDVQDFYDRSWLARVHDQEEYLKLCAAPSDTAILKRQVLELSGQMKKLSESVDSLENLSKEKPSEIEAFRNDLQKLDRTLQHQAEIVRSTKAELEKQLSVLASGLSQFQRDIEKKVSALGRDLEVVNGKLQEKASSTTIKKDFKKDIKDVTDSLESMGSEIRQRISDVEEKLSTKLEKEISQVNEGMEAVARQSGQVPAGVPNSIGGSPVSVFASNLDATAPANRIASLPEFVNAWCVLLEETIDQPLEVETLVVLHTMIQANQVVIASDGRVIETWLKTAGWMEHTYPMAASPLWATETDWCGGARLLSTPTSSNVPRIVAIYDYDIGYVDGYLSPSVATWMLNSKRVPGRKLFLIPSNPESIPSANLLKYACIIPDAELDPPIQIRLKHKWGISREGKDTTIKCGVHPKEMSKWSVADNSKESGKADTLPLIRQVERQQDILLPHHIRQRTVDLAQALSVHVETGCASTLAFYYEAVPWIHANEPDRNLEDIQKYLESLSEVNERA